MGEKRRYHQYDIVAIASDAEKTVAEFADRWIYFSFAGGDIYYAFMGSPYGRIALLPEYDDDGQ